jgi:serine protease Do
MDQLIKQGKVTRGWLGITIQELTPEIAQKFGLKQSEGALVSDIAKGSPAHRAGIMRGDIILEFNGKKVRDVATLRNMVAQSRIGSQVEIKVLRRDKEITVRATIMELPADLGDVVPSSSQGMDMNDNALSGITVMDLNAAIAKQLGIDRDEKGVVIVKVEHGSSAEDAGLRKGDVVQEIDRQRINSLNDFNKIASKIRPDDSVLLFINRSGKKFYVALPPQ